MISVPASLWIVLVILLASGSGSDVLREVASAESRPVMETATELRLARSSDGLAFKDEGQVLTRDAIAPDLVRLSNGHLLAVFDQAMPATADATSSAIAYSRPAEALEGRRRRYALAVARSKDEGRMWSAIRPVRLTGSGGREVQGCHGSLVQMPDRTVRLYCVRVEEPEGRGLRRSPESSPILSATTRDGQDFRIDLDLRIPGRIEADARPVAFVIGSQVHLFLTRAGRPEGEWGSGESAQHFVSSDGRRFERARAPRRPEFARVTDILADGRNLRAFLAVGEGIGSLIPAGPDSIDWKPEEGLRLARGCEPAVAGLKDGTFLMLYVAAAHEAGRNLPQLAAGPVSGHRETTGGTSAGEAAGGTNPGGAVDGTSAGETGGGTTGAATGESDVDGVWEPFTFESAGGLAGPGEGDSEEGDALPPKPDFQTAVDYFQWFQQAVPGEVADNAWGDFQAVEEEWKNPSTGLKPAGWEHGGVIDMFNGEYSGPVGPWNPADHPEWEQTHQAFQNFFPAFNASTWHQNYAEPLTINPHLASYFPTPDGYPLLVQLSLPNLAENRGWVKAVMAEAWRAEGGKVPPQQMIDSLGTVLRNTGLIAQGPSLIHELVSVAEQNMAYDNARLAIKHGVFSTPEDLAVAFQTLVQSDAPPQDPARVMRLEYASAMDVVQYLFPPAGPGNEAQLSPQRAAYMAGLLREISSREAEPYIDQIAQMTPDDGKRAVEALDGFFREVTEKMRTGYPQVRQTDLKAIWEKYQAAGPVVSPFISSMDRVHHIRGRVEAARRATQLTYAVHLFKAQYGRWPSSLAELPAEYGSTIRTDPFTGGYFGYQVTDSGPQIYTLGEDGLDNGAHSLDWGDSRKKGGVDSDDYYFWPPD